LSIEAEDRHIDWFCPWSLLACLALLPWFFSWTGVTLAAIGMVVFGVLGINVGSHRLLTHRSFSCPLWLEHALAVLGTCSLQFSPAFWVAVHRRHHHHPDDEMDPHSPLHSFLWAHFEWLPVRPADMKPSIMIDRYSRDLMRDPLYVALERRKNWIKLTLASWFAFFLAALSRRSPVAKAALRRCNSAPACLSGVARCVPCWFGTRPGSEHRNARAPTRHRRSCKASVCANKISGK
jgi:fatty-acid desaturase